MALSKHILSKTTFLYGRQCMKRLWLHKKMPHLKDEMSEVQGAIFLSGNEVGFLAQQLFPNGIDASPDKPWLYQQSVLDTARYIKQGHEIIYEAAFQFNGVLCAVDILVKNENGWSAYEVKSTTSVKPVHLQDAALQYYVIKNSDLIVDDFSILHLNKNYIRQGKLDLKRLFMAQSVVTAINANLPAVQSDAEHFIDMLLNQEMPAIPVGDHCLSPYPCDFLGFCGAQFSGTEEQVSEVIVDQKTIEKKRKNLQYPLYFLQLQRGRSAIPANDGQWPYRNNYYQFALQKQNVENGKLEAAYHLSESQGNNSEEFASALIEAAGDTGSIFIVDKKLESYFIAELKKDLPHLIVPLTAIQTRLVEMLDVYTTVADTEKKILPTLAEALYISDKNTYDNYINAQMDMEAYLIYKKFLETADRKVKIHIRAMLKKYAEDQASALAALWEKIDSEHL